MKTKYLEVGFKMVKKTEINENEQTQDFDTLLELEVTPTSSPIVEAVPVIVEENIQSDADDLYGQNIKTLAFKIAELENKLIKFEIELSTVVEKRAKGMKKSKKSKHGI